jgi:S1 RNA binding domain protein
MPTEQTNIMPGSIMEGKVQGITNFGAFIELPGGTVGLVHISEIADTYVKDVRDFLQEGDPVKVKVLNVAGKKVGLSIKQANPPAAPDKPVRPAQHFSERPSSSSTNRQRSSQRDGQGNLDEMIAKFLKESDERMQPLKNRMEPRRRHRSY